MPDYGAVFDSYRRDLDGALAQVTDQEFFRDTGANSLAVIVQHLSGNFASRFTDFLTTDGEKPWREREAEFQQSGASRADVMAEFERSWGIMRVAVRGLSYQDLQATVTIRRQPVTAGDALLRSVAHFASHVGQVILSARQFRGDDWQYLSIPPGESVRFTDD